MVNTRQYEFADITLVLAGRDVTGIRGIKYSEKQEKEPIYAKGNRPHSIQKGNISYEGEISLLQSELESLKALGSGSIMGLNLNAVVCYGNPSKGEMLITDTIYGLQFTEDAKEMKQGDKFMEVALPFIALDISYQKP